MSQDRPREEQPREEQPREVQRNETPAQRKRRLAEVFGDVLPDTTSDERDEDAGRDGAERGGDAWLRAQVPPHHGG